MIICDSNHRNGSKYAKHENFTHIIDAMILHYVILLFLWDRLSQSLVYDITCKYIFQVYLIVSILDTLHMREKSKK